MYQSTQGSVFVNGSPTPQVGDMLIESVDPGPSTFLSRFLGLPEHPSVPMFRIHFVTDVWEDGIVTMAMYPAVYTDLATAFTARIMLSIAAEQSSK